MLEILAATTIYTMLIAALCTVMSGAFKLREKTFEALETGLPGGYAVTILKRDLTAIAGPSGLLAGPLIGEMEESGSLREDSIEFRTASGIVKDSVPWGDIQQIEYYLAETEETSGTEEGSDFVRAVTRNLLASTTEDPEEELLLDGVQALEFNYYDGEDWQDSWDSTTMGDEMPEAIRVRIDFVASEAGERRLGPIELVCEIVAATAAREPDGGPQ